MSYPCCLCYGFIEKGGGSSKRRRRHKNENVASNSISSRLRAGQQKKRQYFARIIFFRFVFFAYKRTHQHDKYPIALSIVNHLVVRNGNGDGGGHLTVRR